MPAFGQTREDKINDLKELPKRRTVSTAETNTPPLGSVAILNSEQKKKPHNITINNNMKEPKVKPNIKYTEKQRYRRYKTKVEPNLHNKIEVNEEDDIVNKIKEAFGIQSEKKNTNYSEEITAPAPYNNGVDQPPEVETRIYSNPNLGRIPQRRVQEDLENDIMDISQNDAEVLTLQTLPTKSNQVDLLKYFQPAPDITQNQVDSPKRVQIDGDLRHLLMQEKGLSPEEAANRIKYNLRKRIGRKQAEAIKQDLAAAKLLNLLDPEYKNLTLSPMEKGNKITALDFLISPNEKRNARYSLGLDVALPTPPQFATPIKGQKDAETTKRKPGRPPKSSYVSTNPARFSTGEISNP